jgi:hypothetical protein
VDQDPSILSLMDVGVDASGSASTGPSSEPHYMRITGHGQMRSWVEFALAFFKVRWYLKRWVNILLTNSQFFIPPSYLQDNPDRPLVLHTLPRDAVLSEGVLDLVSIPIDKEDETQPKAAPKTCTENIPRLISVTEIIKREYLNTTRTSRVGLHQYNEIGCLEDLKPNRIHNTHPHEVDPDAGTTEGVADEAEEARRRELADVLSGKRQYVQIQFVG